MNVVAFDLSALAVIDECHQNVGRRDDSDERFGSHDRQAADVMKEHHPGSLTRRRIRLNNNRGGSHDRANGQPFGEWIVLPAFVPEVWPVKRATAVVVADNADDMSMRT